MVLELVSLKIGSMSKFAIFCVLLGLAGCITYSRDDYPMPAKRYEPPAAQTQPAPRPSEVYVPKEPKSREVHTTPASPAVIALLNEAQGERSAGQLDAAEATLERAIRIQPKNARLWHEMASLRLEQSKPRLALDLARKSNSLASGDRDLKRKNWRIIAEAKQLLGDSEGAARALEEADR